MILKIVLPLMVLSTLGDYYGVQCGITEADIKSYNTHRQYDVTQFLNYGIDDFDTHNRQCYLAFLVYLAKNLFIDTDPTKTDKNINDIEEFSTHISRVLNVEFTSRLDSATIYLHEKVIAYAQARKVDYVKKMMVGTATDVIRTGLRLYLWKSEKEIELLREYRNLFVLQEATKTSYAMCLDNFRHLATPTVQIGQLCSKEYRIVVGRLQKYKKTELRDFGALTLFLTEDEFDILRNDEDNKSRNLYIIEYLEQIVIEVIRGLTTVLYQIDFLLPYIPEAYSFPNDTSIQAELLVILKHLYQKVTDTTQDLYLLLRMSNRETYVSYQYRLFSNYFQIKWSDLFSNVPSSFGKNNTSPQFVHINFQDFDGKNEKSDATSQKTEENQTTVTSPKKQQTSAQHINSRTSETDEEFESEFEEAHFAKFEIIHQSRFYRDRRVQPSLIRLYSVLKDSWTNEPPNETNINQMKVFLYDLNAILTVVKHQVYSLTIAARKIKKSNVAWESGNINGCEGPQTGTLNEQLKLADPVSTKTLGYQLMTELQSARSFLKSNSEYIDAAVEPPTYIPLKFLEL